MFFQTDYFITQALRCVEICAAWGIDVLNMSFGFWGHPETFFSNGIWDRNFQFAFDNGVVMVAASGNFGVELPEDDEHIRPATRRLRRRLRRSSWHPANTPSTARCLLPIGPNGALMPDTCGFSTAVQHHRPGLLAKTRWPPARTR
jgi:hypothetical protein